MAIRSEIPDRIPLEKVEVEYTRSSVREERPGFNRARLLDITPENIELATREAFVPQEKVGLTLHVKGVRDFLKVEGAVRKNSRINVLKQPAFSVLIQLGKLTAEQAAKVGWAAEQLVPRQRRVAARRGEEPAAASVASPAPENRPAAEPAPAAKAPAARREVRRPVALLGLIEHLDKFEVTEDLILTVIEAAEAGLDVETLYGGGEEEESPAQPSAEESAGLSLPEGSARPMSVYRLSSNTKLYFSDAGLPVGPPVELFYLSRLKSPETCFAVELGMDNMSQDGRPSFKRGSILVFSISERVEDGDFVFIKTREADEFTQVFFEKGDEVRIRPLNPRHHERMLKRSDARVLYKLVGHYEEAGV